MILRNKDAEKIVRQLTGKAVDNQYRKSKVEQLDAFLTALEQLAKHWKLLNVDKYIHRKKSYGIYNKDMTMVPHESRQ